MKQKTAGKLFFQSLVLVVLLFGLVRLISLKHGLFPLLELAVLAVFLILSVVGLAAPSYGNKFLFLVFVLYIGNLLSVWVHYHTLYLVLLIVAVVGLFTSLPCRASRRCEPRCGQKCGSCCEGSCQCETNCAEPMVTSEPPQKNTEPKVAVEVAETAAVKTKFTPGKYVASKRSNVYHEAKCDWAKKIQKDRRVWFASREEALNKGYKKHECVQ